MKVRFYTPDGLEVPSLTAAQMREVDRVAMEETGPNLFQMMEHAGRALALETLAVLGNGWRAARVAVLAGPGNNGAGGICGARHLANRGVDVRLALACPERLSDTVAFQRSVYASAGGREVGHHELERLQPALIIDALLGYGLVGAPRPEISVPIRWAVSSGISILSLDVPSGVDATSGDAPGDYVRAVRTLTLVLPKTGLRPDHSGEVVLADLGIPAEVFRRTGIQYVSPFGAAFRVRLRMSMSY